MANPTEHPFVAYAAENAPISSLREVFINWLSRGQEVLPRDDDECAAVVMVGMEAYMQARPADEPAGGAA